MNAIAYQAKYKSQVSLFRTSENYPLETFHLWKKYSVHCTFDSKQCTSGNFGRNSRPNDKLDFFHIANVVQKCFTIVRAEYSVYWQIINRCTCHTILSTSGREVLLSLSFWHRTLKITSLDQWVLNHVMDVAVIFTRNVLLAMKG